MGYDRANQVVYDDVWMIDVESLLDPAWMAAHADSPTLEPTLNPTQDPVEKDSPTLEPTLNPTQDPVETDSPTLEPTLNPTQDPVESVQNPSKTRMKAIKKIYEKRHSPNRFSRLYDMLQDLVVDYPNTHHDSMNEFHYLMEIHSRGYSYRRFKL